MTPEQKLTRVRTQLLLDQPWFGSQAMYLQFTPSDEHKAMATDGTYLFYNPEFVTSMAEPFLVFVMAHEVLHCALGHPWRRHGRDDELWQQACDYAVNLVLNDAGFALLPNVLLSNKYRDLSADQIYALLQHEQQEQKNTIPQEVKQHAAAEVGKVLDAPSGIGSGVDSEQDPYNTEMDWRYASEQALRVAQKAGKVPAALQAVMEGQVREGRTDWVAVLREFVQRASPQNYSWTRPNRRTQATGVRTPGFTRDELGLIAIAVDTSRSVSEEMFREFLAEVGSLLAEAKPVRIILLQCDADVSDVREYQPGDVVSLERKGGGGTRFQPVFDRLEADGETPVALLYFTDLDSCDVPLEPEYPVLWVTPTWITEQGPFGMTVRMEKA